MKIKYTFFFLIFLTLNAMGQGEIFYYENFDSTNKPVDWTYEYEVGAIDWKFQSGGYNLSGTPGGGEPPFAYQGQNNAVFNYVSLSGETTKLITPAYNLQFGIKPELRFWHAQVDKFGNNDDLRIYYKNDTSTNWILLEEYTTEAVDWIERIIQLPDSTLTDNYHIAFEGITNNGYGTCIDSMIIIETGVIGKTIESVTVSQSSTNEVPTSSFFNKILRVDFKVQGNEGIMKLDSIAFTSLNTDDENLITDGVKIYYSEDTIFLNSSQLLSGGSFVDGKISFHGLNQILPTGFSSIWLLYDIKEDVGHNMQNNILDAYVPESGIKINNYYYPVIDRSPEGERIIVESIFNDDFETDKSWTIVPDFERAIPLGYGGVQNIGSVGKADPTYATSGSYVLGTDLTDDGDYANDLTEREYQAITPAINAKYYQNTKLFFNRWLNVQITDSAIIDISDDNGSSWDNVWINGANYTEGSWNIQEYNIKSNADRVEQLKIRFALGGTDNAFPMSGWNIDDFFVTGDYISKDVGITDWIAPVSGCGHTDEEYVEVTIQNYAGDILTDPLVISYSFDGGTTIKYDTILNPNLAVDGTLNHVIDKPVDLTNPGWYDVYATTNLAGDEDNSNNKLTKPIFISPSYNLPFSENFETSYGYFLTGGSNSSWEYGAPSPSQTIIDTAASGTKAWVTNLSGNYQNNDSSFLESPCFNFSGIDSIVLEFKCIGVSEDQVDGLTVMYSLDNGDTWGYVPNDHDFYWNWYNETSISELGTAGFDETGGEWLTMRQVLPPTFSNQSSVKFRFAFKSSESAIYEGFGIDDVRVYEAPADVGVASIVEPYTACEWSDTTKVTVSIENYGITTLETGSKIPIGLDFKGSHYTTDTLTLTSSLTPGETTQFTFSEKVDMSTTGDYSLDIYTLLESNPYFYNETLCNDSISDTIRVDGMPNYDIGWIVGSDDLDTLLDAGAGYDAYTWHNEIGFVASTQTYRAQAAGIYYVTVSRTNVLTCEADDSLKVVSSLTDVKMDSILTELEDSCERFELTEIKATISNKGQDLIDGVNDTIPFGYQINNLPEVHDTLIMDRNLTTATDPATDTINFTFTDKCDLTEIGEYTIRVFTNFANDLNRTDDTVTTVINTWGLPVVDLAYDTIYSSQADTLTLDAGSGFLTYNWNSGSSTQTETPSNSSYYYKVTVQDVNLCGFDKDSTYIETHDLGISAVLSPDSICEDLASATTALNVEVTNYSDSAYSSANVKIFYEFDGGLPVEVNPTLTVGSSGSVVLNSIATIDATELGQHTIKIYTSSDIDANHTNDTLEYTFATLPLPHVNLAFDTIFTTQADTVVLVAQEGSATYDWGSGPTSDNTFAVTDNFSKKYIVTVVDEFGCGSDSDSTQIITYNLGITALAAPENECDHTNDETVTITVKNYGADNILSGTIIPINYKLNEETPVSEDYTLTENLNSLESINIPFNTRVDLSTIDLYIFKSYIDYELDAYQKNDTLVDAVKTYGYPSTNLGNDILTTQPDTVFIVADPGYNGYLWDDGSNNDSLEVTYLASRSYSVTVYDINGCTATDDINVFTYDVAASSLINPVSQCIASSAEQVEIEYINNSLDTLLTGESISFSYSINSGSTVIGSHTLTETLYPDSIGEYTFFQNANLSETKRYEFNVLAKKTNNDADTDDAILRNVDINAPDVDLGSDTVNVTTASYEIIPTDSYISYVWSTEETTPSIVVTETGTYTVTVTNEFSCIGIKSIFINFDPPIGFDDLIHGNGYSISYYPNPASNELKIDITNVEPKDLTIEIINIQGQILYNREYSKTQNTIERIDVNSYPQGVYYLRFKIDDEFYMRKLIIQ